MANTEFLFPFPGLTNDKSARLAAFFDVGMVTDNKYDFGELRYSTGVSILWVSPFGPLKVSFAKPLTNKIEDRKQAFQFTFGGTF